MPKGRTTMRRTAIVTGASRGIGRTIALRLAADGFGVVNYAGNAANAEKVVSEITSAGGRAPAIQADVANPEDVKQLFEKTIKAFGQIDVVVNNAALCRSRPSRPRPRGVAKADRTCRRAYRRQACLASVLWVGQLRPTVFTIREPATSTKNRDHEGEQ
jgi:NAD(P)-dependent dehydrogenase (short-subunit alcohol dehydrogenase family)